MNIVYGPRFAIKGLKLNKGTSLKSSISFFLFIFCMNAFASNTNPFTVKERLRLVLWEEGIQEQEKKVMAKKLSLPEEIERPLRKL